MAMYEVRKSDIFSNQQTDNPTGQDITQSVHVEWDKAKAIAYADEKTKETGDIYNVYEIRHVHVTTTIEQEAFDLF